MTFLVAILVTPAFAGNLLTSLAQVGDAPAARSGWVVAITALVLSGCILAISLLSSRRTHRD